MNDHQSRTHLARMGFADPDKKSPLHDLACLYLSSAGASYWLNRLWRPETILVRTATMEKRLHQFPKGSLIGFADVVIEPERFKDEKWFPLEPVGIEVKIQPQDGGSILRQIAMYRMSQIKKWIVFTRFNPTGVVAEMCKNEEIECVQFNAHFDQWMASKGYR
jgi:hypothetical protein